MTVVKVLLVLLAIWIVLSVIGLIIKSLLWLFFLGLIAFVATALFGAVRRGSLGRR